MSHVLAVILASVSSRMEGKSGGVSFTGYTDFAGGEVENPFRPTAGATPPDLIGRGGVLDEFAYGLRIGWGRRVF
jgi:hypothetical protein